MRYASRLSAARPASLDSLGRLRRALVGRVRGTVLLLTFFGLLRPAGAATGTPSTVASPLSYDARTIAMGGAGVALTDSGAAGVHNPALLGLTGSASATATFTPYALKLRAPFVYANGEREEISSGTLFGPFVQLGYNVRVNRRVVVGMVAFLNAAAGGVFSGVPLNNFSPEVPRGITGNAKVAQVAGELRVPVAVQVAPWLHLGASYRVTAGYALGRFSNVAGTPLGEASLRGTHVLGFGFGALATPSPRWKVGVAYRSQVSVDISGVQKTFVGRNTTTAGLVRQKAINTPHEVRAGLSWRPAVADHPLLAGEARWDGYHVLNREERDVYGGGVGAEYGLRPWLALRLGYSVQMQPTRKQHASPIAAPPGLGHATLLGAGVHLGSWRIDAAGGYLRSGDTVSSGPTAGRYHAVGFVGSASASYAI